MAVVTAAGWGPESPPDRLQAKCLAQADIRLRGCVTDARGQNIRMLEWVVPDDTPIDDYRTAKRSNPLSLITPRWLNEHPAKRAPCRSSHCTPRRATVSPAPRPCARRRRRGR